MSATLAQSMAEALQSRVKAGDPMHSSLSAREFQIFCKISRGSGLSQIANELNLSVKTISTYRARVLEKMSFVTNADMTSYALRNGLIE